MALKVLKFVTLLYLNSYQLYAKTRVGEWMHQKDLQKFREQYPDGHSKVTATELGGNCIHFISMYSMECFTVIIPVALL